MLDLGTEILVVDRDEQRTIKAVAELGVAHPNCTVSTHIADLADLGAVRKLADELVAFGEPFDAIVHNTGALLADKTMTVDSIETTLAVHLISPTC